MADRRAQSVLARSHSVRSIIFLALSFSAVAAGPISAQTFRGLLLERDTDRPIELGTVTILDQDGDTVGSVLSDERGYFSVTASKDGTFLVFGDALGYRRQREGPFELDEGAVRIVRFGLELAPIGIEGVEIQTERVAQAVQYLSNQGFYDRQKMGFGHFLTPERLERERPFAIYTRDLFRRIAGVRVRDNGIQMRSFRGGDFCYATMILDGVRVQHRNPDGLAQPDEIEGIEIYRRGSEMPMQYLTVAQGCGVIVIWTKH